MAISKNVSNFTWASGSSTTSGTTVAINTTSDYAQQIYLSIVQVGTATTAASFTIQTSPDASTFYSLTTMSAGTTAGTYQWVIDVPITCEAVQIVYSAQSGGTSSTLTAQLGQVTGV